MHETEGQEDAAGLLRRFLRGRDVHCPLCRYNLRDLTQTQCPECQHDLLLTVGVTNPKFLWFLLAVAPCTFAGIAAGLLLVPLILQPLGGGGPPAPAIVILDALGWLSALGGLLLIRYRFEFLRRPPERQRFYAGVIWGLHVLAFLAFFITLLVIAGGP